MIVTAISSSPPETSPARPRQVMFHGLRVGQVLMSDVMSQNGEKIVKAGTRVTSELLNKLKASALSGGIKEPILAAG